MGIDSERVYSELYDRHFSWDKNTKESAWTLADELLDLGAASIWILVLVSDESSVGVAMFMWMVGVFHARAILWRDPSHRLSNLFLRSLRSVPGLMTHVLDHMVLNKVRRAPYGGGRVFKEAKETVALLLTRESFCQSLIEPLLPSIANDHHVDADWGSVKQVLHNFLRTALGPRVEMRRWFTYIDCVPRLDRI